MVGKWLRFGPDHANRDGLTARHGLAKEIGDVMAAVRYGTLAGVIDFEVAERQADRKFTILTNPESVDDEGRRLAPELPAGWEEHSSMIGELTVAENEVLEERDRQRQLGWTAAHDDEHVSGEISVNAAELLNHVVPQSGWFAGKEWPYRKRLLVAAALLIAEIERVDRHHTKTSSNEGTTEA